MNTPSNLPPFIPTDARTFPEELLVSMAGSRISKMTLGSAGATTVKLVDGRVDRYEVSTNPQRRGWFLAK